MPVVHPRHAYAQLSHYPRYLKAAVARIDKLRADPARDAKLVAEMAPLLTQYQRARSALKGAPDPRLDEFRWLLEELRVACSPRNCARRCRCRSSADEELGIDS